jgi:hypothetical protein
MPLAKDKAPFVVHYDNKYAQTSFLSHYSRNQLKHYSENDIGRINNNQIFTSSSAKEHCSVI